MKDFESLVALARRYADPRGQILTVCNPANGETIAELPLASSKTMQNVITDADTAYKQWRTTAADARAELVYKIASEMRRQKARLARILTLENGKPLKEAEGEIEYAASFFDWYSGEAKRIYGSVQTLDGHREIIVRKEPVGICAAITPWNFPSAMITRKAGAALAAGCSIIIKPAQQTPLSALVLMEIVENLGGPKGLLTVVVAEAKDFTDPLMAEPQVRKLSFTGSTKTGKLLVEQAAQTLKRVTMELGGNAPVIVFDDADIAKAVHDSIFAKFRNAGQTCISINRFLIQKTCAEAFAKQLVEKVSSLKVGDGQKEGMDIGPLINSDAVEKVRTILSDAVLKGAKLLFGKIPEKGDRFVPPIVIDGVTPSMKIFSEEIFGPVCALYYFESEEEAVKLANSTEFGLASYLFTKSSSRIHKVSSELQYGIVGINETRVSNAQGPFGGIKESGYGREGGREGIEEYLNIKYLSITHE